MNLCSDKHEEVCYEGKHCPACELIADHKSEVDDLESQIKEAKRIIEDLESEIERLMEPLRAACLDALKGGDAT